MNVLAIDPGTKTGWALGDDKTVIASGTWDLKGGRFDGYGMRFLRLHNHLLEMRTSQKIDRVVFEEVRRHLGTDAAHVYGACVGIITAYCEKNTVPYEAIPVGTIKKFATGKGNADKAMMLAAARSRWPEIELEDDNHADALWILATALQWDKQCSSESRTGTEPTKPASRPDAGTVPASGCPASSQDQMFEDF